MSGKFQKETAKQKKKRNPLVWIMAVILIVVAAEVAFIFVTGVLDRKDSSQQTGPAASQAEGDEAPGEGTGSLPEETAPLGEELFGTAQTQPDAPQSVTDLGEGLVITQISSYAGLYLEDGSNEVVSGILMIGLENTSDRDLQLAMITLEYPETEAVFMVSNLPAGKKVILLEQSRMAYTQEEPVSMRADNTVFLDAFEMHEDQLEIVALDGAINVTNISDQDIDSDIFVYYKNIAGGVYYGGITYRVRIQGGLKAGEIRQIMTQHFDAEGSEILMVSYA